MNSACFGAVDRELERDARHALRPFWRSAFKRRARCTGSTFDRYQALAKASVGGSVPSVATLAASSIVAASSSFPSQRLLRRRAPGSRSAPSRHRRRARPSHPAPRDRQKRGDRKHRRAVRMPPRNLGEAERALRAAARTTTLFTMRPLRPRGPSGKLRGRPSRSSSASSHRDLRIEREKRHREIAIGRAGEEIAADRRHGAHGGTADLARHVVQESELRLRENVGHRRPRRRSSRAPRSTAIPIEASSRRRGPGVSIERSPELRARTRSVPPPSRNRAPPSAASAAAAALTESGRTTASGISLPRCFVSSLTAMFDYRLSSVNPYVLMIRDASVGPEGGVVPAPWESRIWSFQSSTR